MHPYIPAPYTAHDQFPDAWRGAALSCLVDLGEAALAAVIRSAQCTTEDTIRVVEALEAELRFAHRSDLPGAAERRAICMPLAAAWRAWEQADPAAHPSTAAGQAVEMCWRLRSEAQAAQRRAFPPVGRPRKGRIKVSVHLPPEQWERVGALATIRACSCSDVVADLVGAGLEAAEQAAHQAVAVAPRTTALGMR